MKHYQMSDYHGHKDLFGETAEDAIMHAGKINLRPEFANGVRINDDNIKVSRVLGRINNTSHIVLVVELENKTRISVTLKELPDLI